MSHSALSDLTAMLPAGVVLTDAAEMGPYWRDRSYDPSAAAPLAVVVAHSTEQVQTAVRWAAQHQVPIVPRGAGTGLSGGASGVAGGIVVCTSAMREIDIDRATAIAVVQPGLLNAEVKAAAAEQGLWYPPDPASFEICSIGGNVATNAGGLCCVKYGVTSDYVLGLKVVLADGRAVRLGGPRLKDVAGLSLVKLFVGSEGTLGIITEITLRLLPTPPPARTVIGWFASSQDACAAIGSITATIRPSMLEYMDTVAINAVEDELGMGLHRDAALVIARSDDQHPGGAEIAHMLGAFESHGAFQAFEAPTPEVGEAYARARRIAIPAVERQGNLLLEDVGVPIPRLPDLVAGVEVIAAAHQVPIAFIAHAGDGNTHPLIVFDPEDAAMRQRADLAYGQIMDLALDLGGTITGEHGVGRMKQPWLEGQIGSDVLDLSHQIKAALDPTGLLNPGAIFATSQEDTP